MHRSFIRVALIIIAFLGLASVYNGSLDLLLPNTLSSSLKALSKATLERLSLPEDQCRATFPGLMKEIDNAVARGPFMLPKEPDDLRGLVLAKIKAGKVSKSESRCNG